MAGKTFVAVDRESLDKALAEADAHDKIVVAENAFDATPRLAIDGARWRLNGWTALPTTPVATTLVDCGGYARTWAALERVFADARTAGYLPPPFPRSPCPSASCSPASPGSSAPTS